MKEDLTEQASAASFDNLLEEVLRTGARKLLQQAIENEVQEYISQNCQELNQEGRRMVTRNGHLPQRSIQTGLGPISVRQPRVRDARAGHCFSSAILPRYARRVPSVEAVIPTLYLKGISSNDFPKALEALLGEGAKGLSPTNIVRLKKDWEESTETGAGVIWGEALCIPLGRRYLF